MTTGPNFVRLKLTHDLLVPDNQVVRVPLYIAKSHGTEFGQWYSGLEDEEYFEFNYSCWAEISIHMDWPLDSDEGMRRMEARHYSGQSFDPRIAACQVGDQSGDGYNYSASGPIEFGKYDRVYAEVKQRSGEQTYLQSTKVTWMVIRRLYI